MRMVPLLGCVALFALLCIPAHAQQQGWVPVQWDPAAASWESVDSWDPAASQRRTRLAVAAAQEEEYETGEHQLDDETLVLAPSEYQTSKSEGPARRRTRPQRYNGVSQSSTKAGENREAESARSSQRSGLGENAEVTAPKTRVRSSGRAESKGRRRTETRTIEESTTSAPYVRRGGGRTTTAESRTTEEPTTSAPYVRRGSARTTTAESRTTEEPTTSTPYVRRGSARTTTEEPKESSTSAPKRTGVRGRAGHQRSTSTSTSTPDSATSASNAEVSEATRRPAVRVRVDNAGRRTPPNHRAVGAGTNVPAASSKSGARRSQLPSSEANDASSGDQRVSTTSEKPQHLSPSSPHHQNFTLTNANIPIIELSDTESATSTKSTRKAPLPADNPMHIVVTPKSKLNTINTAAVSHKSVSTIKPLTISSIPNKESKFNTLKNHEPFNTEINSITPIAVTSTDNPFPVNKIQGQNKSPSLNVKVTTNQNSNKIAAFDKSVPSTTPPNKVIQVKSVTVISNTREEISIRPQKINPSYSNVTPKSKTVTVIKNVTPKGEHGKAIVVSTTAVPKIRVKMVNSGSSGKNLSVSTTTLKSVITTEKSLSLNSIIPITPAPKSTSSKLVSVSLKSAVLDLSPPVTTPRSRHHSTNSFTNYDPYNSINKASTPRTNKPDVNNNRMPLTNSQTNKLNDNNPNSRPTTTTDRPYPVFVPELHSSSTSLQPSNQQQVTSLASKRRKVSEVKEIKTPDLEIDDNDNYPEEFKQRLLAGKKETVTTPAPKKKAVLDVDNLVSKPREVSTTISPRKTTPPSREDSEALQDIENLISRPREINTRLRSSGRSRDVTSTSTSPPSRRRTSTSTTSAPVTSEAPIKQETIVRNAAAIRNRGELLRKSIRGRSTPQPSSLVIEENSTENSATSSTVKPRYSARQRRPDKEPVTEVDENAQFVQRFSAKYRSDLRGSVSSTPAYAATVPSVTQLPETDPALRLAKLPSLSLPPKRWTPKSKPSSDIYAVTSSDNLVTPIAQASTISEVSSPSQEPPTSSVAQFEVTSPSSVTTDKNVIVRSTSKIFPRAPKVEVTSPKSVFTTARVRNIIYSSTTESSTASPRVEVTSPTSASSTRVRNIIFSTPEPLTHTLSIESFFPKNILGSRNLLVGNSVLASSTTPATTRASIIETSVTTPKINIKPEMISSTRRPTTSEHSLTTRQATTEKPTTTRHATTPRSTTVQYTSSYSKVASIGLNPATTPIPSVVLGSSAPDIATPPPRFAMRIPIAPIGTKSSTQATHTTTIHHSTYPTTTYSIPVTTTQKSVTSTSKPTTTSARPTATTTTTTTTTVRSTSTTAQPVTTTTTTSTTPKPVTSTITVKLITSSTTRKPSTTSVRTTTVYTTKSPTTTTQAPKYSVLHDPEIIIPRSAPKNTQAIIQDNEIPRLSLVTSPPTRDLAARGLRFTNPSDSVIVTSPSPLSSSLISTLSPSVISSSLSVIPLSSDEPLTALSSSLSLSTEPTSNVSTTERSTYIYKIPPNPKSQGRKGAGRGNTNFRVLTTDTVPITARTTTPSMSSTTEIPVTSTTQFRWKPVSAAVSTNLQSQTTSERTESDEATKTLKLLENLVQATKNKGASETSVYTVTPETPVVPSSTTEFEGLSLANLAYKTIVRSRGSSTTTTSTTTAAPRTTATTSRIPSRGRKVPTDTVPVVSDNTETQGNSRRPSRPSANNGDDKKNMALWVVPKNTSPSTTSTETALLGLDTTSLKDSPGELGGLTAQDLLLLEILSKRRPSGPATASPSASFGGGLDLATLIAAGDNVRDEAPAPVIRTTTRRPRVRTTTQAPEYEPEPSGGGGGGAFQGSGSSLLHILRAIGGASSGPQAPAPAPVPAKYEPQEDVILEPASTQATRTRGRQRQQSGRRPPSTTTTEEPYYDVEPEINQQQPSALVTVAINVTKTVASLMGRVFQGAARTVSAVVRESTRQISGYLQNWQQPPQ